MARVTGKRLAEIAHATKGGVSMATKRGQLPRGADGLYDIEDPRVMSWLASRDRKSGMTPASLATALHGAPVTNPRGDADGEEDSFVMVYADFGEGKGFIPIIRHRFTASDLELDSFHYPLPAAVGISYEDRTCVYLLESGRELPTRDECGGAGFELVAKVHA